MAAILSEDEIKTVLNKKLPGEKWELVSSDQKIVEEKHGYLGHYVLLSATVKRHGAVEELKFFCKFSPVEEYQVDFIETTGAYNKEVLLYKRIFEMMHENNISSLQECSARCYLAIEGRVLVFDNLVEEGYSMIERYKTMNLSQMEAVMQALAEFHASSYVLEEKMSQKLKKPFRLCKEFSISETFYTDEKPEHKGYQSYNAAVKGIYSYMDTYFPKKSSEEMKKVMKKQFQEMYRMVKPSEKYRNVICHGDLWASNIMIKENKCKLVDFQIARVCPPVQDFYAAVYLSAKRDFRAEHMAYLANFYYDRLKTEVEKYSLDMENIMSKEEFNQSLEEFRPFAVILAAMYYQLIKAPGEIVGEFAQKKGIWDKILHIDRSEFVFANCKRNEEYESFIKESMLEIADLCKILNKE